ncbi:MAG: phosphomannomutase/phosphoglucomutase, partial [Thermotogota bacterium]
MRRTSIDPSIFKAYDIRGVFPSQIDEAVARRIGSALVLFLSRSSAMRIVVGRDARESSAVLAEALASGVLAEGADVIDIGLCTTPMLYFAVNVLSAAGGAMVTASHNPAGYNGFKLVREKAIPISSDTGLRGVQELAMAGPSKRQPSGCCQSKREDVLGKYVAFFKDRFQVTLDVPVCIDAGNGAVGAILPDILSRQAIRFRPLFFEPDGRFPNHDPNPLIDANLAELKARVLACSPSIGVAFDGDGDRVCLLDEDGSVVRGDLITALIARELLERHHGRRVLYDLRASRIVPQVIREAGGEPIRTRVGHAFIKQQMRDVEALFAGELSYHFYFEDFFYCESGIYAMLQVLRILDGLGKSLAELVAPLRRYSHSGERNFRVEDPRAVLEAVEQRFGDGEVDHLDGLTVTYDAWWFNLRPSNT